MVVIVSVSVIVSMDVTVWKSSMVDTDVTTIIDVTVVSAEETCVERDGFDLVVLGVVFVVLVTDVAEEELPLEEPEAVWAVLL